MTLGLEAGTLLGKGDAELDAIGTGAVVPAPPGEPGVLDETTGTGADFVFSEQRGHVVIVLVIKLVFTMMEVMPL